MNFFLLQALPMATVACGKFNNLNVCRVITDSDSKGTDHPKYVEFHIPSESTPLEPGLPKWANYVKGVVSVFHGNSLLPLISTVNIKYFEMNQTIRKSSRV